MADWVFEADETSIVRSLLPEGTTYKYILYISDQTNSYEDLLNKDCESVTPLRLGDLKHHKCDEKRYDVIFSIGLFTPLPDIDVQALLNDILSWLRPGGVLVFRETCFGSSGEINTRPAWKYGGLMETSRLKQKGVTYGWEVNVCRPTKAGGACSDIWWSYYKVPLRENQHGFGCFQQFLDNQQYSRNGILKYERVFGRHFVGVGGQDQTKEMVGRLELQPRHLVLDVGSGIGGSAFYMAETFGARVLGIDLSANMISIGWERANEIDSKQVRFEICDATKRQFADNCFDVIFSRDTLLHIPDKQSLFASFLRWLKPGGKLLFSDYSCSEGPHEERFKTYVAQRGYHLLSVKAYGQLLVDVGFENVDAMDKTERFAEVLKKELQKTKDSKEEFIEEFSLADYNDIVSGWQDKIARSSKGDQKWGIFYAEKPQTK